MASFNGAFFEELGDGRGSSVSYSSTAQGRRHRIPGSNRIVVHRNHTTRHALETEARVTMAQLQALRAQINLEGTLTLSKTGGPAQLIGISPAQIWDHDAYRVRLSFRFIGAGYGEGFGFYGFGQSYGNGY